MASFNGLPNEILLKIFDYVENKIGLRIVCKRWRNIIEIEQIYFYVDHKISFTDWHIRDTEHHDFASTLLPYSNEHNFLIVPNIDLLMEMIKEFKYLKYCYIYVNDLIHSATIKLFEEIKLNCSELEHLIIDSDHNFDIDSDVIISGLENLSKLKSIYIFANIKLTSSKNEFNLFLNKTNLVVMHLNTINTNDFDKRSTLLIETLPSNLKHLHLFSFNVRFEFDCNIKQWDYFGFTVYDPQKLSILPNNIKRLSIYFQLYAEWMFV